MRCPDNTCVHITTCRKFIIRIKGQETATRRHRFGGIKMASASTQTSSGVVQLMWLPPSLSSARFDHTSHMIRDIIHVKIIRTFNKAKNNNENTNKKNRFRVKPKTIYINFMGVGALHVCANL